MTGPGYRTEVIAREVGGYELKRFFEGVVIDRFTTCDLTLRRRSAEWSEPIRRAALTPLGVTAPVIEPEVDPVWEAWIEALDLEAYYHAHLTALALPICTLCGKPREDNDHGYGECIELPEELEDWLSGAVPDVTVAREDRL